jgi:hypothetical protein
MLVEYDSYENNAGFAECECSMSVDAVSSIIGVCFLRN